MVRSFKVAYVSDSVYGARYVVDVFDGSTLVKQDYFFSGTDVGEFIDTESLETRFLTVHSQDPGIPDRAG